MNASRIRIPFFILLLLSPWTAQLAAHPVGSDFNADGSSDYPVSIISYDENNPDVGAARIWSGASKTIIHTIVSTDTNTLFGWSTGSAGDLDNDGKDDLVVGEPLWSAATDHEGRIQIFSGDDASVLLSIAGPYADTGLGRYVIGVGDWDSDGTPDIAASGWDIADTDSDGIGDDPIGSSSSSRGPTGRCSPRSRIPPRPHHSAMPSSRSVT